MPKVFLTGAAGFIGFHLTRHLLNEKFEVVGIDNLNNYYDPNLKLARLNELGINEYPANNMLIQSEYHVGFKFIRLDLNDEAELFKLFSTEHFDYIVNLAAQAGVRYSMANPKVYVKSNVAGFLNILELSRSFPIKHLVYASSSSVYGLNTQMPFSPSSAVDHPVSMYAATKRSNELMAHTYSHLYNIPATGLRFFTVYGPWGRPDMAFFLFTKAILDKKPIRVFNNGNMKRDFTYVDDIVKGVGKVLERPPEGGEATGLPNLSSAPWRIYNIGHNKAVPLMEFIAEIEEYLGMKALKDFQPMQAGDVVETFADIADFVELTGYSPETTVRQGIKFFLDWYLDYYKISL